MDHGLGSAYLVPTSIDIRNCIIRSIFKCRDTKKVKNIPECRDTKKVKYISRPIYKSIKRT